MSQLRPLFVPGSSDSSDYDPWSVSTCALGLAMISYNYGKRLGAYIFAKKVINWFTFSPTFSWHDVSFIHPCHQPTYPPTHSLTHPLPPTHAPITSSLTNSNQTTHVLTQTTTHTHSLIHKTHSLSHSPRTDKKPLTHSLTHKTHTLTHPTRTHSLANKNPVTQSLTHSATHAPTHSLTHCWTVSCTQVATITELPAWPQLNL